MLCLTFVSMTTTVLFRAHSKHCQGTENNKLANLLSELFMFCKLQLQHRFSLAKVMLNQPSPEKKLCISGFFAFTKYNYDDEQM